LYLTCPVRQVDYITYKEGRHLCKFYFQPAKRLLFTDNLIVKSFPAVTVGAGVFFGLFGIDPAQNKSTRTVEILGTGAAKTKD